MPARCFLSLLMLITLAFPVVANDRVSFDNAIVRRPLSTQDFTAAYVDITNHGNTQLIITSADAPWSGTIEFHETVITPERARMRQLARLVVEPNATLHLAPGRAHIMLFRLNLNGTPDPTITFVTTDGERLPASFDVKSFDAMGDVKIH